MYADPAAAGAKESRLCVFQVEDARRSQPSAVTWRREARIMYYALAGKGSVDQVRVDCERERGKMG